MPRVRMDDYTDCDYAVLSYLSLDRGGEYGVYRSRHGLVDVYVHPKVLCTGYTSLTFILNGRSYHRSWRKRWPNRTIARLAREFVNDAIDKSDGLL